MSGPIEALSVPSEVVDPSRLANWLDHQGLPGSKVENLRLLPGGTQNVLVRFTRGGADYVLRRPSLTPGPQTAKAILRESRLLAALGTSDVPHPNLIAACEDPAIIGSVFYVMAAVDGFNAGLVLPPPFDREPKARHNLGLALIDGLAALSRVDPVAVGLADFGKLDGFLDRQVARWGSQLDSYRDYASWPGPEQIGNVSGVAEWLAANQPASMQPGLMHGDYHIGNVIYSAEGELAAIVDWELATLGDPLLDFARLTAVWPDASGAGPLSIKVTPWEGFPSREDLIDRYAQLTGRALDHLLWFEVLACYKLGIILEATYARACAGLAPVATGERLHRSVQQMFARAEQWIAERG